jgi:hypothetical protein
MGNSDIAVSSLKEQEGYRVVLIYLELENPQ